MLLRLRGVVGVAVDHARQVGDRAARAPRRPRPTSASTSSARLVALRALERLAHAGRARGRAPRTGARTGRASRTAARCRAPRRRARKYTTSTSFVRPMRSSRPMRCSSATGSVGRSKCTMRSQNWKLRPSAPASVQISSGRFVSRKRATSMSRCAGVRSSWKTAMCVRRGLLEVLLQLLEPVEVAHEDERLLLLLVPLAHARGEPLGARVLASGPCRSARHVDGRGAARRQAAQVAAAHRARAREHRVTRGDRAVELLERGEALGVQELEQVEEAALVRLQRRGREQDRVLRVARPAARPRRRSARARAGAPRRRSRGRARRSRAWRVSSGFGARYSIEITPNGWMSKGSLPAP